MIVSRKEAPQMNCRQCESRISAYISGQMPMEEMQEFLDHVNHCPDCYDDLETTYTVIQGIRQLDSEDGLAKPNEMSLQANITYAEEKIHRWTIGRIARYALNTAAFWSVIAALWFQILWWIRVM